MQCTGTSQTGRSPHAALAVALLLVSAHAVAQYPEIRRLTREDPLFLQHQHGIEAYYRSASTGETLPPLLIYRYMVDEGDTLFGVAARFSLPYSALATLNRLSSPTLEGVQTLLIPGIPGVFLPLQPRTDLEHVMHDLRRGRSATVTTITTANGPTAFRFFAGEDYLPDERRSFLGLMFRHPLPEGELSSAYGPRVNPITAQPTFHGGVDYAATEGTRVLAARGGTVMEVGFNEVLGNYVILSHVGGFQTLYGHLRSIAVSLNEEVRSGMILGAVGSTGMVTGSHLHFEIRQRGRSRDPESMLP